MAIRVAIAVNDDLAALGARTLLKQEYRYQVAAQVHSITLLHRVLRETPPDVLVLSDWFGGQHAIGLLKTLRRTYLRLKIVLISPVEDGFFIYDMLSYGINAYLCQGDGLGSALMDAIDTVMNNMPYLSPLARTNYVLAMQTARYRTPLTDECLHILKRLAHGVPIGEIAYELNVPVRRVYWVREKLRRRFNALTNEHLITCAITQGIIS